MRYISFLKFWYYFIVGDDWTGPVEHQARWLLPAAALGIGLSLRQNLVQAHVLGVPTSLCSAWRDPAISRIYARLARQCHMHSPPRDVVHHRFTNQIGEGREECRA